MSAAGSAARNRAYLLVNVCSLDFPAFGASLRSDDLGCVALQRESVGAAACAFGARYSRWVAAVRVERSSGGGRASRAVG